MTTYTYNTTADLVDVGDTLVVDANGTRRTVTAVKTLDRGGETQRLLFTYEDGGSEDFYADERVTVVEPL